MRIARVCSTLSVALMLNACGLIASNTKMPALDLPETTATLDEQAMRSWWRHFRDPVLNKMIDRARARNFDLQMAVEDIAAARASLHQQQSLAWPTLSGSGGGSRGRSQSGEVGGEYSAGLSSAWELDLWGKISNQTAAVRASLFRARYMRDGLALSVLADTAKAYFGLRAADQKLLLAKKTLASYQREYRLQALRFKNGAISELDFQQSKTQQLSQQVTVLTCLRARADAEQILYMLLGASPRQIMGEQLPRGRSIANIMLPPDLPSQLPSDLLQRRPDIQAAEQSLLTARANIAVARAAYFPKIDLAAMLTFTNASLSHLFDAVSKTWSYSGTVGLPLFNRGSTTARLDEVKAEERKAVVNYKKAVSQAFAEVRTALELHQTSSQMLTASRQGVRVSQRQLHLATVLYQQGEKDYLNVLASQRSLYSAQEALINAQLAQLNSVLTVYKVLGGGWKETYPGAASLP